MSWSVSLSGMRQKDFDSQFKSQIENHPSLQNSSEGTIEQLMRAKEAAKALIDSGAVGESDKYDFTVYLSGHSNPDHMPVSGWANDQITVTVSQNTLIKE
jgi:hypothetical protein